MIYNFLKNIYSKMPHLFQYYIKLIYFRFKQPYWKNKYFLKTLNFLKTSDNWSKLELEEYQLNQLKKLVIYSYENVSYYHELFDKIKFNPYNMKSFADFEKIPLLDKETFRNNVQNKKLISKKYSSNKILKIHTSGTTGSSLYFYTKYNYFYEEFAYIFYLWERIGYKLGDKRVEFRCVFKYGLYEYDYSQNVLRVSPIFSDVKVVKKYLKLIKRFGAKYLHGYPAVITNFARLIEKYNLKIDFEIKYILFSSEKIYPWQKELCSRVFNCQIYSHYGISEQVALAGKYVNSDKYYIVPQYSYVEQNSKTNEIIGTSFLNRVTPLIRYKTNDVSDKFNFTNDKSNFIYFNYINGRIGDIIFGKKGIITVATLTFLFNNLNYIAATQIIQNIDKSIIVKIIPKSYKNGLSNETEKLCENLKKIVGYDVNYEYITELPLKSSGKFKWVINNAKK